MLWLAIPQTASQRGPQRACGPSTATPLDAHPAGWRSTAALFAALCMLGAGCKKSNEPAPAAAPPPPSPVVATPSAPPLVPSAPIAAPQPNASPWTALDVASALPAKAVAAAILSTDAETGKRVWTQLDRFANLVGIKGRVRDVLRFLGLGLLNPFDPVERNAWALAEGRHFGIALLAEGNAAIGAFPTTDGAAFGVRLKKQLRQQGLELSTQSLPTGALLLAKSKGVVRLAYFQKGTLALIAPGTEDGGSPERLLTELVAPGGKTLSSDTAFQESTQPLSNLSDALLYFDGEGLANIQRQTAQTVEERESIKRVYEVMRGLAVGVEFKDAELRADIALRLGDASVWDKIFLPPTGDFTLAKHLQGGAAIALRMHLDLNAALQKILTADLGAKDALAELVGRLQKRMGVNLDTDLLSNLSGPSAIAVYKIGADFVRGLATGDAEIALGALRATVAAQLKHSGRAEGALSRLAAFLKERGAAVGLTLAEKRHGTGPYYVLTGKAGLQVSLALRGAVLLVGFGKGQMERVLAPPAVGKSFLQGLDVATREAMTSAQNLVLSADLAALGTWARAAQKSASPGAGAWLDLWREVLPELAAKAHGVRLSARYADGRLRVLAVVRNK